MIFFSHFIYFFLLMPLISIFLLFLYSEQEKEKMAKLSLVSSSLIFIFSLIIFVFILDNNTTLLQVNFEIPFFTYLGLSFAFGFDFLSLSFIVLTSFLTFICILISWKTIQHFYRNFLIILFLIEFLLFLVFSVVDLLFFYISFESLLIPLFILIGVYGSGERKIRAGLLLFFYTFIGSLGFLSAIIYLLTTYGTTNLEVLYTISFSKLEERLLWLAFFLSFAIKLPLFPFHLWLPEAHVEAPTTGSILLAGILLKMGVYGLIRFLIPLFPNASFFLHHYFV